MVNNIGGLKAKGKATGGKGHGGSEIATDAVQYGAPKAPRPGSVNVGASLVDGPYGGGKKV